MTQEVQIDVKFQMEFDVTQSKADIEKEFDNWMNVITSQFINSDVMGLNGYKILHVKEEAEIYQTEVQQKQFPNGFDSWMDTHYEMVQRITIEHMKDEPQGVSPERHAAQGHRGLYELATEWTDEFEKLNEGRQWDGEFFDEIDKFLEQKNTLQ